MIEPTEQQEKIALARMLDRAGLLWCHVPNGEKRNLVTGKLLKEMGVKKGVPDILIFDPTPTLPFCGVAIELKVQSGGHLSEEQRFWGAALQERRWFHITAKGWLEAVLQLRGVGYKI
jgi:hypothetical protein